MFWQSFQDFIVLKIYRLWLNKAQNISQTIIILWGKGSNLYEKLDIYILCDLIILRENLVCLTISQDICLCFFLSLRYVINLGKYSPAYIVHCLILVKRLAPHFLCWVDGGIWPQNTVKMRFETAVFLVKERRSYWLCFLCP